jgi:hypothetical protein
MIFQNPHSEIPKFIFRNQKIFSNEKDKTSISHGHELLDRR